jgi:hypothetical protein
MSDEIMLIVATLASTLFLGASPVRAASYQTVFATIVDPIQSISGGAHPYSGPNLEPFVSVPSANLSSALLVDADLYVADLRFANLSGSNLDGSLLEFALLIDALLVGTRLVDASLMNANLSGADLTNAVVGRTDLRNANLTGATFTGATLLQSNLTGATFTGATLLQSNLTGANLAGADLTDTGMKWAIFWDATLDGTFYNENTIFPSGDYYDSPPWDLDLDGTTPWDRGMMPVPEPSIGWMLVFGANWVGGLARRRRGIFSDHL